ncbi:MAG: ABC transporter permease [Lachnospiraceae bacterium]|jgi:spermidine/putrescine transport system permease protein
MKKKKRSGLFFTVAPMYIFTLLFVAGPLLYMVAISFATNQNGYGVDWKFTLENYMKIADPVYLKCFVQSFQLALTSTCLIILIGYPFGYFMGKLTANGKRRMMLLIMIPFWTSSLIRLYGWIIMLQTKGVLNTFLMKLGLIREPLKILYSFPAVVIGMVYALLPFMILAVYSSVEKMDWSLVEAAKDLGASPQKAFWTVTFPMTLPGLLSGVVLTFIPSMGLFFIADILGGNKIVLVGSLIQDQMTRGSNWPFAAALAVMLTIFTSLMMYLYRRLTHVKDLEGFF